MNFDPKDQDYFDVFERGMAGHKRSQQRMIGPSGIGDPCDISLTYALAKVRTERRPFTGWKATVGTAVHAWAEEQFEEENRRLGYRRWVTEQSVMVGHIGGEEVWGHSDLFDLFQKTVYDHKFVGASMLKKYKSNGPSQQYRVQAHLYGLGFANRRDAFGLPREVAIAFGTRDGELGDAYIWRQAWDRSVAEEALARANRLYDRLHNEFGGDPRAATEEFTPCSEPFCDYCGYRATTGSLFGRPAAA